MKPYLFTNARVVTMAPEQPDAEAFSVCGDKFLSVGEKHAVTAQTPQAAECVDLGGRTVVPGFIETHNHLSYYALTLFMVDCSPFANTSMDDIKERLKEAAAGLDHGAWLIGQGYDDTAFADGRHLNRRDLDDVAPANPVLIQHASGHLSYTNSLGLKMGSVTRKTPQSAGGSFDVGEAGEPTGVLREPGAQMMVARLLPVPEASVIEEALPGALAVYNQAGITSVHDGAVGILGQGVPAMLAYQKLASEDRLTLRVYLTTMHDFYEKLLAAGVRNGFGSEHLRLGSVKMFQDGSIQGLTAALSADYHCQPGFRGHLIRPQAELDELVARYHRQGLQIACHANGDTAIESIIAAIEKAQENHPQPVLRHMIIHCQMASDDHIRRMKELGAVPSYFPNHIYYWGDRHERLFIGEERAARLDPLGSSARAGLRFTLHADTPVTPIAPLHSMHCAVNRVSREGRVIGPEERISPYQALSAFTLDAAYCSFEEEKKGAIRPGFLADFAVLSENPLAVDPLRIKDIEVEETFVGGRRVYRRGA
jgi:hypothetical protein